MKKIFLSALILLGIMCFHSVYAETESDGYLVEAYGVKKQASLFSAEGSTDSVTTPIIDGGNVYLAKTEDELKYLQENSIVTFVEPNYKVKLYGDVISDNFYSNQWNLRMINADYTINNYFFGESVRVGVIDSGVFSNHIDIRDNVEGGFDFLNYTTDTHDSSGHGTFVSGLIAGSINGFGIVGVSPRVKVVPLKVFEGSETKVDVILRAIYAAVDDYGCGILNMSFGVSKYSTNLEEAINYANQKGVIMVAAAGNDGNSTYDYPASFQNVIGVGAVDSNKNVAYYSQRNSSVYVTAPGSNVMSLATYSGGYVTGSGTSYSAPHVTALCALLRSIDENISLSEIKSILSETAEDLGDVGYDTSYGYGIIDVEKAVDVLLGRHQYYLSNLKTVESNGHVDCRVKFMNNTGVIVNGVLIYSIKDKNGAVVDTDVIDLHYKTDIFNEIESVLDTGGGEYTVKTYIWKGLDSLTPLDL